MPNRHIVASGISFGLGVRIGVNPPITNRNLFFKSSYAIPAVYFNFIQVAK
jgi:hypothetical protein